MRCQDTDYSALTISNTGDYEIEFLMYKKLASCLLLTLKIHNSIFSYVKNY